MSRRSSAALTNIAIQKAKIIEEIIGKWTGVDGIGGIAIKMGDLVEDIVRKEGEGGYRIPWIHRYDI